MNGRAFLSLLHLSSSALPVGAFAYSQGLESAIELGWVNDRASVQSWIRSLLLNNLGRLDLPVLSRQIAAWQNGDSGQVVVWDQFIKACRESAELLKEEQDLGQSMKRLLSSLDEWQVGEIDTDTPLGYVAVFAYAVQRFQLPVNEALMSFCWSWLENQIAVACKTIPLGQTDGQKVLRSTIPLVEEAVALSASLKDDEIGMTLPAFSIASALHETQYSRLFRS